MGSRGRSPLPHTPAADGNAFPSELLTRGRSRPRAVANSASRALSVNKHSESTQFIRKSASRGRRQYVETPFQSSSPYMAVETTGDSPGNNFYSYNQSITPGGILSDMQSTMSPLNPSVVSLSPGLPSDELEVNILYRNAVEDDLEGHDMDFDSNAAQHKRTAKIERQWTKWSQEVIPALLQPYMVLMEKTQSLRDTSNLGSTQLCKGCGNGRLLNVSCVFFNSECISEITIVNLQ